MKGSLCCSRIETMRHRRVRTIAAFGAALLVVAVSAAPEPIDQELRQFLPEQIEQVKLHKPLSSAVDVDPALTGAKGSQEVIIKLKSPSVAMMANEMSQTELMSHKAMLESEQTQFMERTGTSSKEITCVQTLLNAVFLKVDASEVAALADDPDVVSVHSVGHYQMHLSETVPYIEATKVQNKGYDGTGIRVAVLDSGIDYTHASLGGGGTLEDFEAAYKDFTSRDGLFPTDKVVEGYDFVGEVCKFMFIQLRLCPSLESNVQVNFPYVIRARR